MIYKCKMCGGDLDLHGDEKIIKCPYCDSKQTLPCVDEEKIINLFNKASYYLSTFEYSKAENIYETIILQKEDIAEAYWGLCLCKYGIEYITDPATNKKVPTCHRTRTESILNDVDYKKALELSDSISKSLYEEEANYINDVQKKILEISSSEEPYDIFICYKETGKLGDRTQDSVLAENIYDTLSEQKYRVFFSKISLEDKLGKEYEPYIYSALNSAKVMLAIGTSAENFNSAWVKNEWMRFLDFSKNDKTKVLIPCYKNMSPYEMPDQFINLQGLDLNKLGFIQDLIKGLKKIFNLDVRKQNSGDKSLLIAEKLAKANTCLINSDFTGANELANEIINLDPKNGKAFLVKFKCECKMDSENISLSSCEGFISFLGAYENAYLYGDDETKRLLNNFKEEYLFNEKKVLYESAKKLKNEAILSSDFIKPYASFKELGDFLDSKQLAKECKYYANSDDELVFLINHITSCIKPFMTNDEKNRVLEGLKYLSAKTTDIKIHNLLNQCDAIPSQDYFDNIRKIIDCDNQKINNFYNSLEVQNLNNTYKKNIDTLNEDLDKIIEEKVKYIKNREEKLKSLSEKIIEISTKISKCGIFNLSLKKSLREHLEELNKEYQTIKSNVNEIRCFEKEIDNIKREINEKQQSWQLKIADVKQQNGILVLEDEIVSLESKLAIAGETKKRSELWNPNPFTTFRDKSGYNHLLFCMGRYPQTRVSSNDLINKLNKEIPNNNIVSLFGLDFIRYEDEYFLIEPIYWDVLLTSNDNEVGLKALLLSRYSLDYKEPISFDKIKIMNDSGDDYEFINIKNNKACCLYSSSDIRKWLNNEFYDFAFNEVEKKIICSCQIDNSRESSGSFDNPYSEDSLVDKIFLLSSRFAKTMAFANESVSNLDSYEDCELLDSNIDIANSFYYKINCSNANVDENIINYDEQLKWEVSHDAIVNSEHFKLKDSDLVLCKSGKYYEGNKWGYDGYYPESWLLRSPLANGYGMCEVDPKFCGIDMEAEGQFFDFPEQIRKSAIRPAMVVSLNGNIDNIVVGSPDEQFDF